MNKKIGLVLTFLIAFLTFQSVNAELAYLVDIESTDILPDTLYPGDIASIKIDIKNKGSTISMADFNGVLDVGSQFEGIKIEENIDLINPGQTKTLVFRLRVKEDTIAGYYPILLIMNYQRGTSVVQETQEISIPVSSVQKNIDVTVEPRVINPGNQTELSFSLKNVGGTQVSNISFSWEEENDLVLPLGSDNKRYVSVIKAGEEATITYTVAADPNISTGIYPLDIELSFIDSNGTKSQSSQVGLIIGGGADFEVTAELLNTSQLSLSIANIGSNNAEAVVVKLPRQAGVMVSGSRTSILGNLNKGDYTIASFQVQIADFTSTETGQIPTEGFTRMGTRQKAAEADAAAVDGKKPQEIDMNGFQQPQMLTVEIDYTDTTGVRQTAKKTIVLSQGKSAYTSIIGTKGSSELGANNTTPWMYLSAVLAIGLVLGALKADRDNLKKVVLLTAIVLALFLASVYYFSSDGTIVIGASVLSLVLMGAYYFKFRG